MMNLKVQVIKEIFLNFYNFWRITKNLSIKCCKKLWKIAITHHEIQKDIVNAIARETSRAIIKDLDNGFFSILVDELHDILVKEKMAIILRYLNKKGINI